MNRGLRFSIILLAVGAVAPFTAAANDLENCRYANGRSIEPRVCDVLRKHAQERAAAEARTQAQLAAARQREEERKAADAERKAAWQEELRVRREREEAERQARQEQLDREAEAERRAEAKAAKVAADKEAARKASCGADYRNIRVGMAITRAQECVANFKLTGQINRADGVVSTYQAGRMYAHVMAGKIVAWGQ